MILMTRVRFLDHIRAVLTEAVLAGAGRVLRVRRETLTTLRYKPSRHGSPGELVILTPCSGLGCVEAAGDRGAVSDGRGPRAADRGV